MTPEEFCDYARQVFMAGMLLVTDIQKNPKGMEKLEKQLEKYTPAEVFVNLLTAIDYDPGE